MDKTIEKLIETGRIKALIDLPGADFNLAMEIIRRKHFEAQGFEYQTRTILVTAKAARDNHGKSKKGYTSAGLELCSDTFTG